MQTSEFIENFKLIEKHINKIGNFSEEKSFKSKVSELSKNSLISRFQEDLYSFSNLRNILSHEPKKNGDYIAKPSDFAVNRIKEIYQLITNPPLVFPKFKFEVLGAQNNDYLNYILNEMNEKSFSQFPVYENGVLIELINTNTISRWLFSKLEENGNIISVESKVSDLITHIEFKHNYKFISKKTNVFEAFNKFKNQIKNEKRNLDVLFITENGKQNEKVEGLVTIEDIAEFV
ncbi:CBS domain-containing protein [Flavobacterium sp.]|uniref:CBS domain-containing protein n=1 Tax=Flavobacterium sp. TaxID=239 RepID=UPI00286D831D|nr:CBS domain-containing protein [Flavobacterium sp.]